MDLKNYFNETRGEGYYRSDTMKKGTTNSFSWQRLSNSPFESNNQSSQDASATSSGTILSALTDKSFTPVVMEQIDVGEKQLGAEGTIQDGTGALGAAMDANMNVAEDISNTIEQAQAEVLNALGDMEVSAEIVSADETISPDSAVELLIGPAIAGATGQGTMAVILKNAPSMELMGDLSGKKADKEAILDELKSRLTAPPEDSRRTGSPFVTDGGQDENTESKAGTSQFDWNKFFDQGHQLKDLFVDPKNPPRELYPEFGEVQDAMHDIKENQDELDQTKEARADKGLDNEGRNQVEAEVLSNNISEDGIMQAAVPDEIKVEALNLEEPEELEPLCAAYVEYQGDSISQDVVGGLRIEKSNIAKLDGGAKQDISDYNEEFRLRTLQVGHGLSMNSVA